MDTEKEGAEEIVEISTEPAVETSEEAETE